MHQQEFAGGDGHIGECPLQRALQFVTQAPSQQVCRFAAGIVQLDPVRGLAEVVFQRLVVGGNNLADERVACHAGDR